MINGYKLTLKKSKEDHRNFKLNLQEDDKQIDFKDSFALIDINKLKIYDRGNLGSCTANSIAQAIQIKTNNLISICRIFQYFNSRLLEGTQYQDDGYSILDALKALIKYKYIKEELYPYITSNYDKFPPSSVYIEASKNKINKYISVDQDLYHIKYVLSVYLQPIIVGISIYSSFQNLDSNYCVQMPSENETLLGRHCVLIIGYNDNDNTCVLCNSWGTKWGDHGKF